MAACYELSPCAPGLPTLYVASSVTGFLPFVNSFVNISGSCYQVNQSANAANCSTTIAVPTESFDTCLECQGNLQAICGQCPEYYVLQEIDGQTVCVRDQGTVDASFTGELGPLSNGNTDDLFNGLGLNILQDITNKSWPVVGGQNNLSGQWWTALPNPNGGSTTFTSGVANGFFGNYVFRENWFNGPIVYGDTGYSFFSNTAAGASSQDTVNKKNWHTNLFASHEITTNGRLNYGIRANVTECASWGSNVNYYPNPADGLEGFILPSPSCNESTRLDICFNVPETRQYLIGFSADNEIRLLLKEPGDLIEKPLFILKGQNSGVASAFRATSATDNTAVQIGNAGPSVGWSQYHLVPITLQQGANTITVIGINYNSVLSYVCDIINLTLAQFKTQFLDPVTGPTRTLQDLANVCIFSTQRYRSGANNPFNPDNLPIPQVPITSGNYFCPDGSIVSCDPNGIPQCPIISIIPIAECCYKLTDCQSSTEIYTNTDLVNYQGQYVNIDGGTECYLVEQLATPCPNNTQDVQVTQAYSSCDTCIPSYKLFNCKDQNVNLQTANTSFEQYLTKTIKLQEYPNDCWQVGPNPEKSLPLQTLTVTQSFETCAECDPVTYGLTNCVNGVSVLSTADLSNYVGKIIKAENFPGLCFSVTETLCKCLKITINNQPYSINATENNLINGRPYFQFTLQNGDPMTISYSATNNQWEAYNSDTGVLKFYTTMDIDCPATGYWVRDDETFIGNMSTETCPLSILNISPSEEFNSCEPCVNC